MYKSLLIIFTFLSSFAYSQNSVDKDVWYSKDTNDSKVSYDANVNYNLDVGSSFSSFGNQSAFTYYTAPSATIKTSKKFSMTVGFMFRQTQGSMLMSDYEGGLSQRGVNQTQAIVYASGSYQVNPNVTVFASGYYDMNARNTPPGQRNPYNAYGTEGFSVGAEFKVGERTRIGVQVQYDKGSNPYMNPYGSFGAGNYGRGGMGNPYGPF